MFVATHIYPFNTHLTFVLVQAVTLTNLLYPLPPLNPLLCLRWLAPHVADRVVWLKLGDLNCAPGPLVAVQYATLEATTASSSGGGLPAVQLVRRAPHTSVWELRNPALFRVLALEVDRLRPALHAVPAHLKPSSPLPSRRTSRSTGAAAAAGGFDAATGGQRRALRAYKETPFPGNSGGGGNGAEAPRVVVFYSRHSSATHHGRLMPVEHEAQVLAAIESSMRRFRRPETLVVFNGEDGDGSKLSYENRKPPFFFLPLQG